MVPFPGVPKPIAHWLQVRRPMFRHRPDLICCWLLGCQAVDQEQTTLQGLARLAPPQMAEWHVR